MHKKTTTPTHTYGCFPWALAADSGVISLFLFITYLIYQSSKMSGFLRGIARIRTAPVLRGSTITQRANIASRPAKDALGPAVSICRAGWFLCSSAKRRPWSPWHSPLDPMWSSETYKFSLVWALIHRIIVNRYCLYFRIILGLMWFVVETAPKTSSAHSGYSEGRGAARESMANWISNFLVNLYYF